MEQFKQSVSDCINYVATSFTSSDSTIVIGATSIYTFLCWYLFPVDALYQIVGGLTLACLMDVVTKYYAILIKGKKPSSNLMYKGTVRKMISYLIVLILCGAAMHMSQIAKPANYFTCIVYIIFFLREFTSVLENLNEAGHTQFKFLIFFLKKKSEQLEDLIQKNDNDTISKE